MGFPLTVQPLRTPLNLPLSSQRRLNPFLHAAPAHPLHRRTANLENSANVFILHGPVRMGLITQQQDAPVGLLVSRRPATGHQCLQFLPLLRTQLDPVSLHRHPLLTRPNHLRPMPRRIHLASTHFKDVGLLACQSSNCTSCHEIVETWTAATMPRPEVSRSLRVNYLPVFPDLSP